MYADLDLEMQSGTTIHNGELVAGNWLSIGSDSAINITGNGATLQALGDITVQSRGTFGGCPSASEGGEDEESEGPEIGVNLRLVN